MTHSRLHLCPRMKHGRWFRIGAAFWVLMVAVQLPVSGANAQPPALDELLRRAGALTVTLESRLAGIMAAEEYHQGLLLGRDHTALERRRIVSEVVWVPSGDAMVWAFFRDVVSVDGAPVVDRANRLEELFSSGVTPDARRQAGQLLDESARYNLGPRRTVNTPVFALSILHPQNQARFRFDTLGEEKTEGVEAVKVRFSEKGRPTLTLTSGGADVPAAGVLWIGAADGALVASELRLNAPRLPTEIKVRFHPEGRLGTWLPLEMKETYGSWSGSMGEERLEATALYSNFRRGEVEVQVILPGR
jgi:hypothetical protein